MKKIQAVGLIGILSLGMILFLAACNQTSTSNQPESNEPAQTEQNGQAQEEADTNIPIVSYEGTTLSVTLAENGTTGYVWSYSIEGGGLTYTGEENILDDNAPDIAGAGGKHVFRFQGISAGDASITFTLSRPWEDEDPVKKEVILVTIAEDGTVLSFQLVQ